VLLNRLEGVQVDQGVMGRILNYGAILVSGTGGTRESFQDVARPMEFRQRVQQSMASSGTPAQ
jgi:Bacterial PH domain